MLIRNITTISTTVGTMVLSVMAASVISSVKPEQREFINSNKLVACPIGRLWDLDGYTSYQGQMRTEWRWVTRQMLFTGTSRMMYGCPFALSFFSSRPPVSRMLTHLISRARLRRVREVNNSQAGENNPLKARRVTHISFDWYWNLIDSAQAIVLATRKIGIDRETPSNRVSLPFIFLCVLSLRSSVFKKVGFGRPAPFHLSPVVHAFILRWYIFVMKCPVAVFLRLFTNKYETSTVRSSRTSPEPTDSKTYRTLSEVPYNFKTAI